VKTSTLIDTDILIDVWGPRGAMNAWARAALTSCSGDGNLIVNPIVWSEIAPLIRREAMLDDMSSELAIDKEPLPWAAAFLAGIAHSRYRCTGGVRERTLPDFLIGAHAVIGGHRILTRDASRYRAYFPNLEIISPDTHP
jgi:predicted nucleic acid-binding protein